MSIVYYTICCDFKFIGMNHSPKFEGKCRDCGQTYQGEISHAERDKKYTITQEQLDEIKKELGCQDD